MGAAPRGAFFKQLCVVGGHLGFVEVGAPAGVPCFRGGCTLTDTVAQHPERMPPDRFAQLERK